jgi:hypothetical protein
MTTATKKRVPYAEMKARSDLAMRALDDVRAMLEDADPVGDPEGFKAMEAKALAIFAQMNSLLPETKPLSDEERARMEEQLADKPDDDTLRELLHEMERMADDPTLPDELRQAVDKVMIRDALASLDEVALLQPIAQAAMALSEEMLAPKPRDARKVAVRQAVVANAAKLRN